MAKASIGDDLLIRQIGDDDQLCNFRYDPSMWGNPEDADQPVSCPYDSVPGMSFCIFHLPLPHRHQLYGSQENINREFIRTIAEKRVFMIFCTTINSASLSTVIKAIPGELDLDLSFVNVRGELDLSNVDISNRMSVNHCDISRFMLSQSHLKKEIRIIDSEINEFAANTTTFNRHCNFVGVEFGKASIMSSTFQRYVTFHETGYEDLEIDEIDDEIGKDACVFHETAEFMGTKFENGAMFNGTTFEQSALFGHTEFSKGGSFYNMDVNTGVDFNNAYFGDHTSFEESDLGIAAFYYCKFDKSVLFENVTFGNEYTTYLLRVQNGETFSTSKVHELAVQHRDRIENVFVKHYTEQMHNFAALFNQTIVKGELNLIDAVLKGGFRADSADFHNVRVRFKSPLTTTTALFHRSALKRGVFHMDHENCFIELRNATLGAVEIKSKTDSNPFDNIYFDGTNFDGFEFSDYRDYLDEINWEIDGAYIETEYMEPIRRETTYSKAKTGASQLGDRLAESKFSILEGRSRRARYKDEFRQSSNPTDIIRNGYKFVSNGSYDLLSKYGESPQRVFAWSLIFVMGFSLLFNSLVNWGENNTIHPFEIIGMDKIEFNIGSLIFSIQSFTSFIVGRSSRELGTLVRFFASAESFIGAFFIALFVATVVRKIKR